MRKRFEAQLQLGQTPIELVSLPTGSRDELPPVLAALQWIFCTPEVNAEVFGLLERKVQGDKQQTGRPGMDLWHILVLGVARLALNCDWDRLEYLANNDALMRRIMGVPALAQEGEDGGHLFNHRTIRDNLALVDEELLGEINVLVAGHGRELIGAKKNVGAGPIEARVDSYVLETNVHYPTDTNLLWDALRVCLRLAGELFPRRGVRGFRKWKHSIARLKALWRHCEKMAAGGGAKKAERLGPAARAFLKNARTVEARARSCAAELGGRDGALGEADENLLAALEAYLGYLGLLIDQVDRRLLQGEAIPHEEKIFSIFEPHTEFIKKGKARPPVELGHKLLVVTDQHGLVIDYKVMDQPDDHAEAVAAAERLLGRFGQQVASVSFDKGFSSKANRDAIEQVLPWAEVVMPKKGRRGQADKEREGAPGFRRLKNRHSAVESDINRLEHHGLDRCPDRGLPAFKRYAALGVLAANLHLIGRALLRREAGDSGRRKAA